MARLMRKVRTGSVVRTGQEKTAVVEMVWKQRHRIYGKQMRRVARFHIHDPENKCQLGDVVRIEETRPISKSKHWRLLEILQSRQVADVAPIELESDAVIVVEEPEEIAEEVVDEAAGAIAVEDVPAEDSEAQESSEESTEESSGDSPVADSPTSEVEAEEEPQVTADEVSGEEPEETADDQETQEDDASTDEDQDCESNEDGQR